MHITFKKFLYITSFSVTMAISFGNSSVAQAYMVKNESSIQIVRYESEYQRGREDIADGKALIDRGEDNKALGYKKRGQQQINEGTVLVDRGRREVEDSQDQNFSLRRDWRRHDRFLHSW